MPKHNTPHPAQVRLPWLDDSGWKACKKCGKTRQHDDFAPRQTAKDGRRNECNTCRRTYLKERYNANPLRQKMATYRYREQHPGLHAKQQKHWREGNPEAAKAIKRRCYINNADKYREASRMWRKQNPEKAKDLDRRNNARIDPIINRARIKAWRKRNPHKYTAQVALRRARKKNAPSIEKIDREALFNRDGWICWLCGQPVTIDTVSLDHVIPLSRGGAHTADNLRTAHRLCNSRKGAKIINASD